MPVATLEFVNKESAPPRVAEPASTAGAAAEFPPAEADLSPVTAVAEQAFGDELSGSVDGSGEGNGSLAAVRDSSSPVAVKGTAKISVDPAAQAQDLVRQIADQVQRSSGDDSVLRIKLTPVEFGEVQVEVAWREGQLSARIQTQSSAAQQVLSENLGLLREAMSQRGIVLDRVDVQPLTTGVEQSGLARESGRQQGADERSERRSSREDQSHGRDQEAGDQSSSRQRGQRPPRQFLDELEIEI